MYIFEGFIIGLLGSLHCIGMCGPIVLALPLGRHSTTGRIMGGLFYNIGRAITYAMLGLIFGLLGLGFRLTGLQQLISVIFGILMILAVLIPGIIGKIPGFQLKFSLFLTPLKNKLGRLMHSDKLIMLWIIGLLNGLLPCGLVYVALSGAVVSNSVTESVLFMFLFGLGTLPVMFAVVLLGNTLKGTFLNKIRKMIPYFIIILGILFILRGLNLGIKYISPKLDKPAMEMHQH